MKLTEHLQMKTKIDDVTFRETFETNKIKRRSDHGDRNKKDIHWDVFAYNDK